MEGGRHSRDDLEVRLRWPGDVDDDSSPNETARPSEPRPVPGLRRFPAEAEAARNGDRPDSNYLERALGPLRAEIRDSLDEIRSEMKTLLDAQQATLERLGREVQELRGAVKEVRDRPVPWFSEAVSASLSGDLTALAAQVQMLRRRMALKAREESRVDAHTAEKVAEAVADRVLARLAAREGPDTKATAARRARRT